MRWFRTKEGQRPEAVLLGALWLAAGFPGRLSAGEAEEAYRRGDYGRAESLFREFSVARPADPGPLYGLGSALYRQGRFPEAGGAFREALRRDPDLAAGWYNLGNALFRQDRFRDAVEAYERALALDPEDGDTRHNLELARRRMREEAGKDQSRGLDEPPPRLPAPSPSPGQKGKEKEKGNQAEGGEGGKDRRREPEKREPPPSGDAEAGKSGGLTDRQVEEMLSRIEREERRRRGYFSRDPRRDAGRERDVWNFLPREQAEFLRKFFGEEAEGGEGVEQDW